MFVGKKLEIKAGKEVKNRQVSPVCDKESSQGGEKIILERSVTF